MIKWSNNEKNNTLSSMKFATCWKSFECHIKQVHCIYKCNAALTQLRDIFNNRSNASINDTRTNDTSTQTKYKIVALYTAHLCISLWHLCEPRRISITYYQKNGITQTHKRLRRLLANIAKMFMLFFLLENGRRKTFCVYAIRNWIAASPLRSTPFALTIYFSSSD